MDSPRRELRLEGRVEMHLAGGFTKVAVKFGGAHSIDVKTEEIPNDLRAVGTTVLVVFRESEEIFHAPLGESARGYESPVVKRLPDNAEFGWFPKSD